MKVIVVGVGGFGYGWLKNVLINNKKVQVVGVVDNNPDNLERAGQLPQIEKSILFSDIQEALKAVKPDFILNITPPVIHKDVCRIAFDNGIPVLCEKPIAENDQAALEIIEQSRKLNVPIMISENYRFSNTMRAARRYILSGEIGKLNSIHVDFQRKHRTENYHMSLRHPLLLDVAIHHIDMIRYLSGVEAKQIYARGWRQKWSWYSGFCNVDFLLDMEDDIKVSYRGSLSSPINETAWSGDWMIEGEAGIIKISDNKISIIKDDITVEDVIEKDGDSRKSVLEEFISSLEQKRKGETDILDNYKTCQIVYAAMESIDKTKPIDIIIAKN